MRHQFLIISVFFLSLLAAGCRDDSKELSRLEEIKTIGDRDPYLALQMLDSVMPLMRWSSDLVQKKCELLEVRLKDKAYIPITSDIIVKDFLAYFDKSGNNLDKQEAHYYAGSVYRDMNDLPSALSHFLIARDIAVSEKVCDSVMLRNTYSNLHYIYYNVQDYQGALAMARREYDCSRLLGNVGTEDLFHIGASLQALDQKDKAAEYYNKAYEMVIVNEKPDVKALGILLYYYTRLGDAQRARVCYERIGRGEELFLSQGEVMAVAEYLVFANKLDTAAYFFRRALANENYSLSSKYDAARRMLAICVKAGSRDSLAKYADLFIKTSDSINLGTRQELAATVNNKYKYNRDIEAEAAIKTRQERMEKTAMAIVLGTFLFLAFGVIYYLRGKYKTLRILLSKDVELKNLKQAHVDMLDEIRDKEDQLEDSRSLLESKAIQLQRINDEIDLSREEVSNKEAELARTQAELEEKVRQNEMLLRSLHSFTMTKNAEDVRSKLDLVLSGRYKMQEADWGSVYQAVDREYPSFTLELAEKLGTFDERQKQFCYLTRMGMTNGQIETILNVAHVTIWRWSNKYRELLQMK